jgi:hypothetical protein
MVVLAAGLPNTKVFDHAIKGGAMANKQLLAYFGHHKCATTWTNAIVGEVCQLIHLKFVNVNDTTMFQEDLRAFVEKNNIDFLAYTNAKFKYVGTIDNFRGFHVIRDPRDIVVSAYFSHLYSHPTRNWPELIQHRQKLMKASKEEGLFLEIDYSKAEFEDLYNWNYSQPNVLEIKMEDLIKNAYETIVTIFEFLEIVDSTYPYYSLRKKIDFFCFVMIDLVSTRTGGLSPFCNKSTNIPLEELLAIIYRNRFSAKAKGRIPGEEDTKSHYRKGIAGDWANHFSSDHKNYFKENYSDLLIKLGYEKTNNW